MLSDLERERYKKHIMLKPIGEYGQEKLKKSSVLLIGAGGVSSPCALYLVGAGIGKIGIADGDSVEISNLHRQILYCTDDIGKLKTESAEKTLHELNSEVSLNVYSEYLNKEMTRQLANEYDFIIDGADGLETKMMIADACDEAGKPHCHAMIGQFRAQIITCTPENGNSFRRIFSAGEHYSPVSAGTFSPVCGIAGSVQAAEAIKYLLGIGNILDKCVLYVNLLENTFQKINI